LSVVRASCVEFVVCKISPRVKILLNDLFHQGRISNKKLTPEEAVRIIYTRKLPNGKLEFGKDERLEPEQVASYWSRLKRVRERAPAEEDSQLEPVADEDVEVAADEHIVHVSSTNLVVYDNIVVQAKPFKFRTILCSIQRKRRWLTHWSLMEP
jgi:hypothetical protein